MASIIVDLSDDIKKIQSLKTEIQEVKKELGSINVNVHLDIKRDMEAKLKSLTSQYDALVKKVSEAEGKVIASTQRINQAAEKIIAAQERLAKAAGAQPQAGNASSGANAAAANAETASVQAQAKAYDELADEIDAVMGTKTQNIRRMIEEEKAISNINEELKRMKKLNRTGTYSGSEIKRMEQLNASLLQHKTALSELRQSLNNSFKLDNAAATSMNALSQSLARMRMTYRELTEEERNSPFGKELLSSIQQADAKIKQLDATIGNHQRNVGNYASGWNGLGMSIQQIGRELPSLAVGWSTFFLAISNNLPILSDEIARARREYNELKAAGQKATPVWKQVVSSLFSWQTALTVGITLLTLYGKEVVEWIGGLFKARKQIDLNAESLKAFNEAMLEGGKNAQQEITTLNLLYRATQNTAKGMNERLAAVDELQKRYPSYFGNMSKEEILAGKAADSYVRLAQSITAAARAQAALESIKKQQSIILENEQKIDEAYIRRSQIEEEEARFREKEKKAQSSPYGNVGLSIERKDIQDRLDDVDKEIAGYRSAIYQANKLSVDLESRINIEDLIYDPQGTEEGKTKAIDSLKGFLEELAALREDNEDRQVELMEEGTDRQIAGINLRYNREIAEVKRLEDKLKKAQGGSLTDEQQGLFGAAYSGIRGKRDREYDAAVSSRYAAELQAMQDYLKEYGTFQQRKLAIAQEYAEKIAKAQTEGERMALERQRDSAVAQVNTDALKMDIDWVTAFSGLDGVFSDVIRPVLEQVKEYMKSDEFRRLDASDQSSIADAARQMEEAVGGLANVKFSDLGKGVKVLQQSVLDLNDAKMREAEAIERLQEAQEEYEKALKDGTQEQADIAKLALDEAQNKADAASKNVDAQQNIVKKNSNQLNDTVTTLDAKLKNVTQGLQQLSSGGLSGLYQGITKLVKGFGGTAEKLGDIELVGAIFSALDALKEGIVPILESVPGQIFGVLNNVVSDIFSGDIFVTLFDSLRDGIGGFWDAITFGGFSSWTSSSNAKEVQETIDRLTDRNEALKESMDALNDTMKQAKGTQTVEASKRAEEYQKEINRNYLDIARAQAGYHGSHHSWQYYMGWSEEWIEWIRENIDETFSGTDSLWSWTPEQMQILKSNSEIWEAMKNAGEGGYGGRVTDKLDDFIDQAGKLDEIVENTYELLTQISFDSMYDSFIDNLMNMEYAAEDAADDISEYFMRAMLANQIGYLYSDKLKEWWKKFGEAMENDGKLDEDEIRDLRDEYLDYVNEALDLRDNLAAATGYGKETQEQQSATERGFETMTQDQASELSGRFTAVAESNYRIEGGITQMSGNISAMAAEMHDTYGIADEMRSILANSYLELQEINENTGESARYLKEIRADIAMVKQNTARI